MPFMPGMCPPQTKGLYSNWGRKRGRPANVVYVALMAAVIVAVDFLFFRNHFWERLTANTGIVLVFAAFYFRFLKHP
jgi:hypothetical protein